MTVTKRERSVMPVYLIALVWIFATFVVGIHSLWGYLGTAACSVAAFLAGRAFFPDKVTQVEVPDPEPADPRLAALKKDRDGALSEMRRLNDNIEDEEISRLIDRLEESSQKIFDYVLQNPEKQGMVRRFQDYYLPTVIKLLNQYDRMDSLGSGGENVTQAQERICSILEMVCQAFDRQLDALFHDESLDISAEATVLEQMMRRDGLTGGLRSDP